MRHATRRLVLHRNICLHISDLDRNRGTNAPLSLYRARSQSARGTRGWGLSRPPSCKSRTQTLIHLFFWRKQYQRTRNNIEYPSPDIRHPLWNPVATSRHCLYEPRIECQLNKGVPHHLGVSICARTRQHFWMDTQKRGHDQVSNDSIRYCDPSPRNSAYTPGHCASAGRSGDSEHWRLAGRNVVPRE